MTDFKKNITNITKEDREKYFQMPQKFDKYVDDKDKKDNSLNGQKKRLEEQLNNRQRYVEMLEGYLNLMRDYEKNPTSNDLKSQVEQAKLKIDIYNTEIETTAQKNVFVDTYIYYKEDFMKRYKEGGGKKQSIFNKNK